MKTIEELAREAGLIAEELWGGFEREAGGPWLFHTRNFTGVTVPDLTCFAALVRAQALEEAAKVCETMGPDDTTSENCAEALRALKDKP